MRRSDAAMVVAIMGLCLNGATLAQPDTPAEQHNPQTPQSQPDPGHPQSNPAAAPDTTKQDQEYLQYLAALKRCQQLSADERDRCVRETKQHYDRM